MKGTLQLAIGGKGRNPMLLEYDLGVSVINGGLRLFDQATGEYAELWDVELEAVTKVGNGPTPLTALLVSFLIEQKFEIEN
jgi:hypothetical protein